MKLCILLEDDTDQNKGILWPKGSRTRQSFIYGDNSRIITEDIDVFVKEDSGESVHTFVFLELLKKSK